MRIQRPYWRFAGLLALALLAAGCTAFDSDAQVPVATAVPAPTRPAPTAAPATTQPPAPTATTAPAPTKTAIPAVTATAVPATAQPEPTEAAAPPTATPIALLPASEVWVRIANTISATGDSARKIDLQSLGFPTIMGRAVAAPDGSYVAYVNLQDRLTLLDMSGGAQTLPDGGDIHPVGFSFSPDSRSLAFTLTDGQTWKLKALDLRSGATRTLQEGTNLVEESRGMLSPLAWTPAGLFVERIFWATDAPPQELAIVHPADGRVQSLRKASHLQAAPAPEGTKVALVKGEVPIGGTPMYEIAVLDIASGEETTIVLSRQGFVKALRWSPDGTQLLYAASETYDSHVTSVIAVNADGGNSQRVDFGLEGFELRVHDVAWHDAATPLVLLSNQEGRIQLSALPLDSFDVTGLRSLGTFEGDAGDQAPQILYVPHGA